MFYVVNLIIYPQEDSWWMIIVTHLLWIDTWRDFVYSATSSTGPLMILTSPLRYSINSTYTCYTELKSLSLT